MLLVGCAVVFALPAYALDTPQPIHSDEPQMRQQVYNPAARTLLVGTVGRATVLTFGHDEQVKRVIFGSDSFWEAPKPQDINQSPLNNVLPLWAVSAGRTTLQVITAKAGAPDRVYQFSAVVQPLPAGMADDPAATYGLMFTYPDDERLKKAAEAETIRKLAAERNALRRVRHEHVTAVARLQQDFTCVNGLYEARGDRTIAPDDACDDGQSVGLMFRGNRQLPAVFLIGSDGKEQSVRVSTRGDWLIVPALRERMMLRLGEASALEIVNRAFDPRGVSPGTGTTSPDVVREIVAVGRQ